MPSHAHPQESTTGGPDRETILFLGGSSDIGLEIMRQLAVDRPRIVAHFNKSGAKIEELKHTLPDMEIVPIQADLANAGQVEAMLDAMAAQNLIPDKIVHLPAPKFEYVRFKDATWDHFQNGFDVQVRSLVQVLQRFLPIMAQRKRGKVVVVLSSVTLNIPPVALSHYVTTKYALLGLVRALAAEYSGKQININAVSPSMVETAFLEKLPDRMVEIAAAQTPWQRNGTPQDVAGAVRFLLSADADFMTGVNLPVTGGSAF